MVSLAILLEVFDHLLHVVLEVDGEVLLGSESGLDQAVVQDHVDAGDGGLVRSLVGFLGRGVGTLQDDLTLLAGFVLENIKLETDQNVPIN